MIKRMNKKGQGGLTWEQVLGIILGGIAVFVILGFVTGTFGAIGDLFKKSEIDVAFLSQKCEGLLSSGNIGGFCSDKIQISSTSYMNCQYAIENLGVTVQTKYTDCGLNTPTPMISICNNLKLEQGDKFKVDKIKVNGYVCSHWDPANFTP